MSGSIALPKYADDVEVSYSPVQYVRVNGVVTVVVYVVLPESTSQYANETKEEPIVE